MAFTEFTCRSGGSNLNAGTLDGSAEAATTATYTSTGGNWNGTSVFTPTDSTNPVSSGVAVGQFASVYVTAGATVATYVGRITAVTNAVNGTVTISTTAKVGTAPTTGTGTMTLRVGGAWQGPNAAVSFPFSLIGAAVTDSTGNPPRVNFKNNATYSITAAMTFSGTGPVTFQGYTTTFGDGGRATFDGGTTGTSYNLLTLSSTCQLLDVILQNNGATGAADGLTVSNKCFVRDVVVNSVRGRGIVANANGGASFVECEAYLCNASNTANYGGIVTTNTGSIFKRCISHDNAGANSSGFHFGFGGSLVDCIADTNGGHGINVNGSSVTVSAKSCTIYNNTGSGINLGSTQTGIVLDAEDCLITNNGAYGLNNSATLAQFSMINCAFRSNTSGTVNAGVTANYQIGAVTLSGDPYSAAASGDFRLNSTAGGGASCREAGVGTYTQTQASYTGTVAYPDVGAAQHQDAGGAAGMLFVPNLDGV